MTILKCSSKAVWQWACMQTTSILNLYGGQPSFINACAFLLWHVQMTSVKKVCCACRFPGISLPQSWGQLKHYEIMKRLCILKRPVKGVPLVWRLSASFQRLQSHFLSSFYQGSKHANIKPTMRSVLGSLAPHYDKVPLINDFSLFIIRLLICLFVCFSIMYSRKP